MKTKSLPIVCALLCTLVSNASFASGPCYTVYGKDNKVVYRSEEPPIDLSAPIHRGMAKRFPNGHLVTQAGVNDCPLLLPKGAQAGISGAGPDDSPALKLPTPFTSAQAQTERSSQASGRKRIRTSLPAVASAVAPLPQVPVVTAPRPQAATSTARQEVSEAGSAGRSGPVQVASYRRSDGSVVAAHLRSAGGHGRR